MSSSIFLLTARAGRADFIQPSLGPLQPNFEDFMDFDLGNFINGFFFNFKAQDLHDLIFFADIFNTLTNNRLAPVPEEQTDELLKAIEFPMIGEFFYTYSTDCLINSIISQGLWTHKTCKI